MYWTTKCICMCVLMLKDTHSRLVLKDVHYCIILKDLYHCKYSHTSPSKTYLTYNWCEECRKCMTVFPLHLGIIGRRHGQ